MLPFVLAFSASRDLPSPPPVFADTLYMFSEWFSLSRLHPRRIAVLLPPAAAEPVAGPSTGKTEFDHPILFILYFICFCTPGCGLCCFCTPGCGLCCFCTPVCGLCCIIVHCFLFPSSRNTRHPAVCALPFAGSAVWTAFSLIFVC